MKRKDGALQSLWNGDPPKLLDKIADAVMTHKPKPKTKPARKRARRAKKIAQAADV